MAGQRLKRLIRTLFSREVILYVIVGVLTTLVNLVVFTLLSAIFGNERWWLSNAPAILAAIIFAFFTNRIFVFRSKGPILMELWKFILSRIFVSLASEYGVMFLLFDVLRIQGSLQIFSWSILTSKLITQAIVMIGNYVFSKWFIFTSKSAKQGK